MRVELKKNKTIVLCRQPKIDLRIIEVGSSLARHNDRVPHRKQTGSWKTLFVFFGSYLNCHRRGLSLACAVIGHSTPLGYDPSGYEVGQQS